MVDGPWQERYVLLYKSIVHGPLPMVKDLRVSISEQSPSFLVHRKNECDYSTYLGFYHPTFYNPIYLR